MARMPDVEPLRRVDAEGVDSSAPDGELTRRCSIPSSPRSACIPRPYCVQEAGDRGPRESRRRSRPRPPRRRRCEEVAGDHREGVALLAERVLLAERPDRGAREGEDARVVPRRIGRGRCRRRRGRRSRGCGHATARGGGTSPGGRDVARRATGRRVALELVEKRLDPRQEARFAPVLVELEDEVRPVGERLLDLRGARRRRGRSRRTRGRRGGSLGGREREPALVDVGRKPPRERGDGRLPVGPRQETERHARTSRRRRRSKSPRFRYGS